MKNKKLKIAIISKLWETTSPFSTGGTGMSVGNLVNGLVDKGHFVTLFATGNSKTRAQKLISIKNKPYKNDYSEIKEYQHIFNCYNQAGKFDIINTHIEHKACFFAPLVKTPSLITLRYGEFWEDEKKILKTNSKLNYSTISESMTKLLTFINFKKVIYNGINLNLYPFNRKPKKFLLFLARLSPQKGPDVAIRIAKKAKIKLIMAGKISEVDKRYLEKEVFKYVDNRNIIYCGEIKFKEKLNLLQNALCLLHPVKIFEAFGNALIEAGACGTPVISFNNGSPKEIIKNGFNGWVVKNDNEMEQKVKQLDQISREKCRQWVENHFSLEKMVNDYEKLYYEITDSK